jgi:hypothetical protein
VNYHRSSQCRDEEYHEHMRRVARAGGIKSGKSRRERLKSDHGSVVDPTSEDPSIRDLLLSISAHLARSGGSTDLDSPSGRGLIDLHSGGDPLGPSEGTQSGQTPSKNSPLWAPSVLKRVAPASPATVAHRVLRGRKVGPAPAAPPARLSARTARIQRDVRTAAARPETLKTGGVAGPDFKRWYERYRKVSGNHHRRGQALDVWADLEMSTGERRALMRFTERRWRPPGGLRPAAPPDFLLRVWLPELQLQRRKLTQGEPSKVGDHLVGLIQNLKRRGGTT